MSKFRKTWTVEAAVKIDYDAEDVETLAKLGTPPQDSVYTVIPGSLRTSHTTIKPLKEVNDNGNKVPRNSGENFSSREGEKKSAIQD